MAYGPAQCAFLEVLRTSRDMVMEFDLICVSMIISHGTFVLVWFSRLDAPRRLVEWNSVDSSSKSESSGATAAGDISGDALNAPSRSVSLDGDPSSASTSASGSYRSSRPESSTNVVYVQFEGEQVMVLTPGSVCGGLWCAETGTGA